MKNVPLWILSSIEQQADCSWHELLTRACSALSPDYFTFLDHHHWLPGKEKIFNAFRLPLANTRFILYGESPYPRTLSANGYAFWDAAVDEIWSEQGLSKPVNRATSLRNLLKMLIAVRAEAHPTLKTFRSITTLNELFQNFLAQGFLLLNFNLSFSALPKKQESRYWIPFHHNLLEHLHQRNLQEKKSLPQLVLLGKIAQQVLTLTSSAYYQHFIAEHPYNLSFITNQRVRDFFRPFELLNDHR